MEGEEGLLASLRPQGAEARAVPLPEVDLQAAARLPLAFQEVARVLGGGIVPGSSILLGGDPGIGKSTLLLQLSAQVARSVGPVLYASAEESARQIGLRARRLGIQEEGIWLLAETEVERILAEAERLRPALLVVDSIQTVRWDALASAAGSVSQVRECASLLTRFAKARGVPVFLVGHVTKEGTLAGPRVLEHIVDVVLYLEGDRFHRYRILRGVKNRFGSTYEVGVFEMGEEGLREVGNPSAVFLAERRTDAPGSAVAVTLEGTRPLLVEVQALCAPAYGGLPRRTTTGFDPGRLQMLLAVLSRRVGLRLGNQDVYVNVVGGLRIQEPAADLAVAVAVASGLRGRTVDPEAVFVGEVGLAGELRSVGQLDRRLQEARKLGFRRAVVPRGGSLPSFSATLEVETAATLEEALALAMS